MLMTPADAPQALTHVFCLFELTCTLRSDVPLEVVIPPGARHKLKASLTADFVAVANSFGHVDVESASARNPDHLKLVMGMIRTEFGIQNTNSSIQEAIVRSMFQYCIGIWDLENPEGYRLLLQLCADKVRALSPEVAMRLVSMRNSEGLTLLHKAVLYGASGVFRELQAAPDLVPLVKAQLSVAEVIAWSSLAGQPVSLLELLDISLAECRDKPNGEQKLEENGKVLVTAPMLEDVLKLCQQITGD